MEYGPYDQQHDDTDKLLISTFFDAFWKNTENHPVGGPWWS